MFLNLRKKLDLELGHSDTKKLQQRGLVAVQRLTLLANGVGLVQHDLALFQPSGHAPFPDGNLHGVRERHVFLSGQLTTARVYNTSGNDESLGGLDAGAGEVGLGVALEVLNDLGGLAVGAEETDVALEALGKLVQVGEVLGGVVGAEGLGHDLGLAEKYSARTR